jgi:hypothetical protein
MSSDAKAKEEDEIGAVTKAARNLREIASIMAEAYSALAAKVRPDYEGAAGQFQIIAQDLGGYARNLGEFLAPYYYFSFAKPEQQLRGDFQRLAERFQSKQPRQWISDIKFKCGEIDSVYDHRCKSWLKNRYGEHVAAAKRDAAQDILKSLTAMDGYLIEALTDRIMEPLKEFIAEADAAFRTKKGGLGKAESAHDRFREKTKDVFGEVETTLSELDEAVRKFKRIAKRSHVSV